MTRVLITGASGFVGSHFMDVLLSTVPDCEVVALSSFTCNGVMDRIVNVVERHPQAQVTVIQHDLSVAPSKLTLGRIGQVDWILDLASRSSVDESIADPVCFITNNVAVTLNTLEIARQVHLYHYVHLSTDEVYGQQRPRTFTDHLPSSPYSASKAAQESICHAYKLTYDVPMIIVNSSNMFGERQSSLAFIPRVVRALLNDETVSIHVDENGPGSRNYTHAQDVATWVISYLMSAYNDDLTWVPSRLPLTGIHTINNLDLALRVASIMNRELRFNLVSGESQRRGYDSHYHTLDEVDDWLTHFGGKIDRQQVFDRRLKQTVEWFVENPGWLEQ
jgi:dTDP-glucose 4,6-dehydratase